MSFSTTLDYTKDTFKRYTVLNTGFFEHAGTVFSCGIPKELGKLDWLPDSVSTQYVKDD